jgi:dimethylargininase
MRKKLMFSKAIVRTPARSFINGLRSANLGSPDYEKALDQHAVYVDSLEQCGLEVTVLDAEEQFPDSTFVEDTALLTRSFAIITRPGAVSRMGETQRIEAALTRFFSHIESIQPPGTVDGGDVMLVGSQFYIGLSKRTNVDGAEQLLDILNRYGMTGSTVPLKFFLHLKSGVSYIENNNLVITGEFINAPEFEHFDHIAVDETEGYAANCLWINGKVLVAEGHPKVRAKIESTGYETISLNVSEFRKLDGGLSCLSLRF